MDRYKDGSVIVFTCIAGMVAPIVAFLTLFGNWVTLKMPFHLGAPRFHLLEFANASKKTANVIQYFSSNVAAELNIMSLAATISYWVLIIGGVISLVVSLMILFAPKTEVLIFIPYVVIIAFAVIGLIFVVPMIITPGTIGVTAIPIVFLLVTCIPAVILRLL